MAVTLDSYMPYDSGPGSNVSEDGWRSFAKYWRGDGVIRAVGGEFAVFGDSTGMQVKAPTGDCWIQGNWGTASSQKTLPIAASHATLGRRDLVILRNDFVNNRIEVDVLTGTPSATPGYPSLTQNTSKWEIQLGKVVVGPTVVTITAGNVTAIQQFTDASCRWTVDTGLQTIANITDSAIDFDITRFSSSGVDQTPDLHSFVLRRTGMWMIQGCATWTTNSTGDRAFYIARDSEESSNRLGASTVKSAGGTFTVQNCTVIDRFTAGTTVRAWAWQNSGGSLQLLQSFDSTCIAFYWLGP